MIELSAAAAVGLAFILSLIGTVLVRKLALSLGFIDQPGRDRLHSKATPLLGGVAITAAILIPSILALVLARVWSVTGAPDWLAKELAVHIGGAVEKTPLAMVILAGCVLLHVVGLIDDRKHLGPWLKLAAQILAAGAVVFIGGLRLMEMAGEPFSSIASILWLVLITNAFNFLDNIDGLSAGVAAICSAALLTAAAASGQLFVAGWLCLLLGASLGFLVFNFPPAKIFMGDAGSLVLGFMLGVLSILTTYYRVGSSGLYYSVFVPVILLAVPLYDTISVVLIRIRHGRNPMIGDQRHFSHRLLKRGMSPRKAVMTIYLATAATAAGASLLPHVNQIGAIMVFAQTVGIVSIIALLESADGRGKP